MLHFSVSSSAFALVVRLLLANCVVGDRHDRVQRRTAIHPTVTVDSLFCCQVSMRGKAIVIKSYIKINHTHRNETKLDKRKNKRTVAFKFWFLYMFKYFIYLYVTIFYSLRALLGFVFSFSREMFVF